MGSTSQHPPDDRGPSGHSAWSYQPLLSCEAGRLEVLAAAPQEGGRQVVVASSRQLSVSAHNVAGGHAL